MGGVTEEEWRSNGAATEEESTGMATTWPGISGSAGVDRIFI
jgi:hypothetical protein